jgi:hypothetical protein
LYPFIEAENAGGSGNVKRACELLKVSRAAYYTHRTAGLSTRDRADAALAEKIVAVHDESNGTYGTPRIHAELAAAGIGMAASASPGSYAKRAGRDEHRNGGAPPRSRTRPRQPRLT